MKTINVLSPGFTSPNSASFLFPLIKFKKTLKDGGYDIRIINRFSEDASSCDYLLIDSKFFKNDWGNDFTKTLETIAFLGEKTKLFWSDQADSTGTFLGQVLPFVHRYLKAQILVDKKEYLNTHYASRIYTDYYHQKYGIIDDTPYIAQPAASEIFLNKIGVSWNSAYMNYGWEGPYMLKLREKVPLDAFLYFSHKSCSSMSDRPIDISCRMGISYSRNTVCYQRLKIKEILKNHISANKVSRRQYLQELQKSKISVSPFGLGEITLKDFETFLSGALLLKPDMSHMKTWPDLYIDGQTCVFHNWDLDNVLQKIEYILSHKNEYLKIAENGQRVYLSYTCDRNAPEKFANHFKEMIDGKT